MRGCVAAGMLLTLLLFGGAWITAPEGVPDEVAGEETPAVGSMQNADAEEAPTDSQVVLKVWDGEAVREMTVAEYLPGVVRGEMPASFEPEALKAQAVAERTYIYYKIQTGGKASHPDADVCMSPACCSAYTDRQTAADKWGDKAEEYEKRIQQAVEETDGQVMLYGGEPIFAAFHSSSAGVTANSGDVWVKDLPYLASVESPEGEDSVPNYYSVKTVKASEFKKIFAAEYPAAKFSTDTKDWIGKITLNDSDRVESVVIGGVSVEGTAVRSMYGLRSACFTVETESDAVIFRVTGYGHGVGMSQYGANELAKQGKTWREILQWYYTGVSIETYSPEQLK